MDEHNHAGQLCDKSRKKSKTVNQKYMTVHVTSRFLLFWRFLQQWLRESVAETLKPEINSLAIIISSVQKTMCNEDRAMSNKQRSVWKVGLVKEVRIEDIFYNFRVMTN